MSLGNQLKTGGHILIRRMLEKKEYETAYKLASTHHQSHGLAFAQAEWLAGWIALRFLNKRAESLQHFETLYGGVSMPVSKSRAAYWAGRSCEVLLQDDMKKDWYRKAAQYQTTFYGQVAASELRMLGEFPRIAPPKISVSEQKSFANDELLRAAGLLHMAGLRKQTSDFIEAFVRAHRGDAKAYLYAADYATSMEHYHDTVRIAKKATQDGMFLTKQAYPVLAGAMNDVDVEWALVHALIRQESMFDYKAVSPAGAMGLMQLMPSTAAHIANSLHIAHSTNWLTQRPNYNIKLGSTYIKSLINRYDGSYVLAIAAYNAGPARVDGWIKTYGDPRVGAKKHPQVDFIDWIELIPVYETRNYVQRVLESTYIYRLRLKDTQAPPVHMIHVSM